jgi:hypothetical protein
MYYSSQKTNRMQAYQHISKRTVPNNDHIFFFYIPCVMAFRKTLYEPGLYSEICQFSMNCVQTFIYTYMLHIWNVTARVEVAQ